MVYSSSILETISCELLEFLSSIAKINNKNSEPVLSEICRVKRDSVPLKDRTKNFYDILNYENSTNRNLIEEKAFKLEQRLNVSIKENLAIDAIILHE
jgi:hypothetical protein